MMLLPLPEFESTAPVPPAVDYAPVLERLAGSAFRRRKRLLGAELEMLQSRGLEAVLRHARDFVEARLAPALPADDGRQTPYRGHPAFIAQHATATCCRSCLETWHSIPKGRPLGETDIGWVVGLVAAWLCRESGMAVPEPAAAPAKPKKRRPHNLRLIVADAAEPAPPAQRSLVLEEREGDGSVRRRWLQLELF